MKKIPYVCCFQRFLIRFFENTTKTVLWPLALIQILEEINKETANTLLGFEETLKLYKRC